MYGHEDVLNYRRFLTKWNLSCPILGLKKLPLNTLRKLEVGLYDTLVTTSVK
jgi:hypothetical protein